MAQLTYTDKSLKKMIELFPKYQNALGEEEVVEHFRSIVGKVRYFPRLCWRYFWKLTKFNPTFCHSTFEQVPNFVNACLFTGEKIRKARNEGNGR